VSIYGSLTFTNTTLNTYDTLKFEQDFEKYVNTSQQIVSATYSFAQTLSRRRLMVLTTPNVISSYRLVTHAVYTGVTVFNIQHLNCTDFSNTCNGELLIATPVVSALDSPTPPSSPNIIPLAVGIPVGVVGGGLLIGGGVVFGRFIVTKSKKRKRQKTVDLRKIESMKL